MNRRCAGIDNTLFYRDTTMMLPGGGGCRADCLTGEWEALGRGRRMQPVFIFSGRASGANELGDVLNGNGLACLISAFDGANRAEYGLTHFLRSCAVGAAELIDTPDGVLDDYLSTCAELVRAEEFCIEVRHDFMHLFNGRSNAFGQRPRLVDFIRQRRYRAVFVCRRRIFEQALLVQLGENAADAPLAVDLARCEQQMRQLGRLANQMALWFRGYDRFHGLAHEAVFEAGMVSDGGAALLEAIFDRPIASRALSLPAVHHDFRRLVANAGDVIAAFADGPHGDEVREMLG